MGFDYLLRFAPFKIRQCSGEDEGLTGKAVVRHLPFFGDCDDSGDFEVIDQLARLRVRKVVYNILSRDFADVVYLAQLVDARDEQFLDIAVSVGYHCRGLFADLTDSERVYQPREPRPLRLFDRRNQICRALFTHALETRELVCRQRIYVGNPLDQTLAVQLSEQSLTESVDVHSVL